ncbi:hypothetical protein [Mesoflavibacter sp. CH_XMU1404-2]|uniref:hypothetical protein n=1 Tax=Mesoflavibacter sp. CH_XMU1404-2 TaxID=3107766 RepID=UPI0030087524
MRKIEFILYSEPIQEEWNYTELYKKATEIGALIKVDKYNNELILSKVTDELIVATIKAHIDEIEPKDYYDQVVPLDGGLRIENDDLIIEHQCCSELNDYLNWKKIISETTKKWKEIWIGHPSVFYRNIGSKIELSEYYETNPKDKDIETKMSFELSEFIGELEMALSDLDKFKERVYRIIDNGNYENKEVLKKALIE